MIKAAAVMYRGKLFVLPPPNRHHNVLHAIADQVGRAPAHSEATQGFVTHMNVFVTREAAAKLALRAGQIKEPKGQLFSEDLW